MGTDEKHGSAPDKTLSPPPRGRGQFQLFRTPRPRNEWVGGFISFPWEAADYLNPPRVAIWLELPEGLVVGTEVESTEGDALIDALRAALTEPLDGPPRRPDALRVADDRMADAVRFALTGEIPVVTGATPEIEDFEERLRNELEVLGDHAPSHFDGGVSAESFERLFRTTSELFTAEPWSIVDDVEVLQVDIPSLNVEGACVSICGASSDIKGLMVLPSYDEFDRHYEAALDFDERRPNAGMFVEMILVGFHPEADVPSSMLAEVREHGWPLAGTDVYPLVSCLDEEGFPREATERDIAVIAATAHAIAEIFNRHWDLFESQGLPRFTRSYRDEAGHRVEVTVPHPVLDAELEDEPFDEFAPPIPTAAPFRPRAARNAPCPCGSGRKYKKCHLRPDEEEHAEVARATAMHVLDNALIRRLIKFALSRFEKEWRIFQNDFARLTEASEIQFAWPWAVYGFEVRGSTVAEIYRDAHPDRCSKAEHRWMDAQRSAWMSVWEVEAVEPGSAIALVDLLSGERRTVREVHGSRHVVKRQALLARVVDHEGLSLMCGPHPVTLSPRAADEVVERTRRRLRRKSAAPVERLRDPRIGRYLIRRWEEIVEEASSAPDDGQGGSPADRWPEGLRNTDDDALLFTVDRFDVEPREAAEARRRVDALEGARTDPSGEVPSWAILRPDDPDQPSGRATLIGRVEVGDDAMRVETNSVNRADALRERIEAACGPLVRHRIREHTDPLALAREANARPPEVPAPEEAPSPEEAELAASVKARHYADWADHPLPALGGRTPRGCMETETGRADVHRLLKDMEYMEELAPGPSFDFSVVRRELGLEAD